MLSGAARSSAATLEGDVAVLSGAVSGGMVWTGRSSTGKKGSCRVWVDSSTHDWTPSYRFRL